MKKSSAVLGAASSSSPAKPNSKPRLLPPVGIADEGDMLFPHLKIDPPEPKLQPPRELLGRNPFSELRRRAEHQQHLAQVNANTQKKIDEARDALQQRRAVNDGILNSQPVPLTADEIGRVEERGEALSSILDGVRSGLKVSQESRDVVTPTSSQTTTLLTSPTLQAADLGDSTGSANRLLWSPAEAIDAIDPATSAEDAATSKAQLIKHKAEKHRGYFGQSPFVAAAPISPEAAAVERPREILSFHTFVERLLSMHPSTSDIETYGSQDELLLDRLSILDTGLLAILFGDSCSALPKRTPPPDEHQAATSGNSSSSSSLLATARIKLTRLTGTLSRNSDACPKGVPPSSDPPAFLQNLCHRVIGKPAAVRWLGDPIEVDLYLSRYAFTTKYCVISTACRNFPNVFSRFGVDIRYVERACPFPLRLPDEVIRGTQDVTSIRLSFHAKTQTRLCRAEWQLPVFQGFVISTAELLVSGPLSASPSPPSDGAATGEHCNGSEITKDDDTDGDWSDPPLRVELRISIPDHVSEKFQFRGVSSQLGFLDLIDAKQREFHVRTLQPRLHDKDVTPFHTLDPDRDVSSISLAWNIKRIPLFQRLFDQEVYLPMVGRLSHTSRSVTLQSPFPSERTCVLWNFVRLTNVVAFLQCEEGCEHPAIFGVECDVEVLVGNHEQPQGDATTTKSSSNSSASESAAQRLVFSGRLWAPLITQLSHDQSSLDGNNSASAATVFRFDGDLQARSIWSGVGGSSFLHVQAPKLHFELDGASSDVVPRMFQITGSLVLQRSGDSVGVGCRRFSCDTPLWRPAEVAGHLHGCVVNFPVDSFPHFVLHAPLVSIRSPEEHDGVPLSHIAAVLSSYPLPAEGSGETFTRQNATLSAFVLHEATLWWNASHMGGGGGKELTLPGTWQRAAPGCRIEIVKGRWNLRQGQAGASVPIAGRLQICSRSSAAELKLQLDDLRCLHPVFWCGSSSERLASVALYSSKVGGQGPSIRGDFTLSDDNSTSSTTGCRVFLEDCNVFSDGMGMQRTSRCVLQPSITTNTTGGGERCDWHIVELVIDALCVPPHISLENRELAAAHRPLPVRKSLESASRQSFTVRLQLESLLGMKSRDLCVRKCFIHEDGLRCGVHEALRDIWFGKVAELQAEVDKALQQGRLHAAAMASAYDAITASVAKRDAALLVAVSDFAATHEASVALSVEAASIAARWSVDIAPGLVWATQKLRQVANASPSSSTQTFFEHQKAVAQWQSRLTAKAQVAQMILDDFCVLTTAAGNIVRTALCTASKPPVHEMSLTSVLSSMCEHAADPSPSLDSVNGAQFHFLRSSGVRRAAEQMQAADHLVRSLEAIQQQLSADMHIFASLFTIQSASFIGGSLSGPSEVTSKFHLYLAVIGTVRSQMFRTTIPLRTPLDHASILLALDHAATEILRLYLTSLRSAYVD